MLSLTYSIADQNVATTKSMGIYNLSVNLARSLSANPRLEKLTVFSNHTISPSLPASEKMFVEDHDSAMEHKAGRIWWDQWGVYRRAAAWKNSWLFLPKGFCSFVRRPRVKVAAYVHDTMEYHYRGRYPRFQSRLENFYFARSLEATLRRAGVIFTNTEFSRSEILKMARQSDFPAPEVIVAGYGFDVRPACVVEKENRVLLFASTLPHKRTDMAIQLLNQWQKKSGFDGVIDCIGILSPVMERPAGRHWNWVGRVPPAEGRDMMRRARAIVYVSEYEGFGMPPVEAVMEGTAPVFSDIPPLREVMGGAGCAFANSSAESFFAAMEKALATTPRTLQLWSEHLLGKHNWPAVTEKIVGGLLSHAG